MRRVMLTLVGLGISLCVIGGMFLYSNALLDGKLGSDTNDGEETQTSFPFAIDDTGLIAERLIRYNGPFWENGAGSNASDVAALLVHNSNAHGINHARIVLETEAGELVFEVDRIPAGKSVLIPEMHGASYSDTSILNCKGWTSVGHGDWSGKNVLKIRCTDMGTIALTNETDKQLIDVQLYYKSYVQDPGYLVGGRSFVYVLHCIGPKQTIHIYPENYAKGYSEFVRIEWKTVQ